MSGYDPRSLGDKLLGMCFTALLAAAALFIAVRLIEAIWTALLVILGVAAFLLIAFGVLRARDRGW